MCDLKRGFYDVMSFLYISIPEPLNFLVLHKSPVHYPESHAFITGAAQRSKALHLAGGVTTDPGSNPGCITPSRDWESHRAAHN